MVNLKYILVVFLLVLLFSYFKFFQGAWSFERSWPLSVNDFDDSLDRMKHDLQYAVIIDAGSSGSRVYIYVWPPHSGDTRNLLNIRLLHDTLGKDLFYAITPGLSSCAQNASQSSDYIAPLIDFAATNIPESKHKETPLYILATAGMRLLPERDQNLILEDLRRDIPAKYSFLFTPNNVEVITGKDEGIYSWISINYLMGRFDHTLEKAPLTNVQYDSKQMKRMSTISMLEMGGASVQIAFEITSTKQADQLKAAIPESAFKQSVVELNLGCSDHDTDHKYRLYVTTFLQLGANSVRQQYVQHLINGTSTSQLVNTSLSTMETTLYDPCLSIDSSETINITRPNDFGQTQLLYYLRGSGNFSQCQDRLRQMITGQALSWCNNITCPFTDLQHLTVPFQESEFYGISEFWYTMNDVYQMGGHYSRRKFVEASTKYCSTSWLVTQDRARRNLYPNADNKRLMGQCFKSAWISSLLHDGLRMPDQYSRFKSVSMLKGEPVQWTLGAILYRTRFFPLRSLDNQNGVQIQHVVNSSSVNAHLQYVLVFVCIAAVLVFIYLYVKRLRNMANYRSKPSSPLYYKLTNTESYPLYNQLSTHSDNVFINFN